MDIWQIKQVKLGDLIPNAKNPRKISQEKLAALQDKIERLGFHNPIKTDENMQVLGGNQRLKALLKIAGKDLIVPVMVPNRPLTDEEKQEVIITDNISDGTWDWEKLSKEWDKDLTASWVWIGQSAILMPAMIRNNSNQRKNFKINLLFHH